LQKNANEFKGGNKKNITTAGESGGYRKRRKFRKNTTAVKWANKVQTEGHSRSPRPSIGDRGEGGEGGKWRGGKMNEDTIKRRKICAVRGIITTLQAPPNSPKLLLKRPGRRTLKKIGPLAKEGPSGKTLR